MPEPPRDNEQEKRKGKGDDENSGLIKAEPAEADILPSVAPPSTKAPVQFNQQVNIYQQIPPSAWDRLTPEQILDLSKAIITQIDIADKRQFDYAMEEAKTSTAGRKLAIVMGALITIAGFLATIYMALNGHEFIALTISLPLATILAIVVGNRFLD